MKAKWLLKKIGTTIWDNRSNIEFVAGNILVLTGTGMIISKAEEAVEVKQDVEYKKKIVELTDEDNGWESQGERTKACFDVVKTGVIGYTKVYAPGAAVEIGGLILMGISKATDRKEIAVTSAALASTTMEFMNYRKNVVAELGEEKDEEFLTDAIKETVKDENGKETEVIKPTRLPDHSFLFDECNDNYDDRGFSNLEFLEDHERWLNERLWYEGILWENDIRRDVGAPIDPDAESYGITAVDENGNRNYISFGINKNTERAAAFRDGSEKSFLVILNNMEPNISKKMYRLNKYHRDVVYYDNETKSYKTTSKA